MATVSDTVTSPSGGWVEMDEKWGDAVVADRFAWKATDVRMRHVVHLYWIIGHHHETRSEIAMDLGVSQATVSSMIGRALKAGLVSEGPGRVIRFSPDLPPVYGVEASPEHLRVVRVNPTNLDYEVIEDTGGVFDHLLPDTTMGMLKGLIDPEGPYQPRYCMTCPSDQVARWESVLDEQDPPMGVGFLQDPAVSALTAIEASTPTSSVLSINRCITDGGLATAYRTSQHEPQQVIGLDHYVSLPGRGPLCPTCRRQGCLHACLLPGVPEDITAQALSQVFVPLVASLKIQSVRMSGFTDRVVDLFLRELRGRTRAVPGSVSVEQSQFGDYTFAVGAALRAFKWWFIRELVSY